PFLQENSMTLESVIEQAWENRAELSAATQGEVRNAVFDVLSRLDKGDLRVAEKKGGTWQVNQWMKKAVLLSFRLQPNRVMGNGEGARWFDKVDTKFSHWSDEEFKAAGFRAVPGSFVR